MSTEPEVKSVNLSRLLADIADRTIRKAEQEPLEVELVLADRTITVPVPKGHAWYDALNQRRNERLRKLRASFKPGIGK